MKVLVIGNGGREHALAWKAAQSPLAEVVYVAPGNPGTALEPKLQNVNISVSDIDGLLAFAKKEAVDLTIVGPEAPLVAGVVDAFRAAGLKIFGPTKAAAQLEGSKSFTKDFLLRHNIPTAHYAVFTEVDKALAYIDEKGAPIVIKADGLAAGKGVIVAMNVEDAKAAVKDMLADNAFGDAGSKVVIEEFLSGEEASFIVMVDGDEKVMSQIIYPTVQGMKAEGNTYTGFLYAGLMIDAAGNPKVIEYNCRFGDPETQPIMLRMDSDLVDLCYKATEGRLKGETARYNTKAAVGVVLAAENYPASPKKGDVISGLDSEFESEVKVFHAGTALKDGNIVTNGGRVLCVTALGNTVLEAKQKAYRAIKNISWNGMFHRNDIADRAIAREQSK